MTPLVVRYSVWKNGVLFALCSGFVLAWLSTLGAHSPQSKMLWAGGLFFALGAGLFGYRTFDRRPRLIVDANGIIAPRASIGLVPWSEIGETRIRYLGRVDTVQVIPNDPAVWIGKLSPVRRMLWRWFPNSRMITFQLQNMDVPTSAIAELLSSLPVAKLVKG
jgi:hypothetical protein